MSFFRLVPSIKRLTEFAGAPFAVIVLNCVLFVRSSVTLTPGARAARSRKLRVVVGSFWICCGVTLVATSDVRVSIVGAAVTATVLSVTAWAVSAKSWICVAPI